MPRAAKGQLGRGVKLALWGGAMRRIALGVALGAALVSSFFVGRLSGSLGVATAQMTEQTEKRVGSVPKAWGKLVGVTQRVSGQYMFYSMFFEATDGTVRLLDNSMSIVQYWDRK